MRWHRLSGIVGALVAAQVSIAASARAQAIDAIELRVVPDPRGCVTEAALRARIASLKARADGARGLALVVNAAHSPEVLELRRDGAMIARRSFETLPERCSDRLETIALVVALAIEHAIEPSAVPASAPDADTAVLDEQSVLEESAKPTPPAESTPAAAPNEPEPVVPDDDEPVSSEEPAVRTVLGVGGSYGLPAELAGLFSAGIELPGAGLRIGLGAVLSSQASTQLAGGTAQIQLAGARGYGCVFDLALGLDVQACAGLTLGVVIGSGRDYAPNADATGTLLAPLLRLGARYPAHGLFSVGVALEGFVHLVRPELQVSGRAGTAHALPLLGTSLSIEGVLALE